MFFSEPGFHISRELAVINLHQRGLKLCVRAFVGVCQIKAIAEEIKSQNGPLLSVKIVVMFRAFLVNHRLTNVFTHTIHNVMLSQPLTH